LSGGGVRAPCGAGPAPAVTARPRDLAVGPVSTGGCNARLRSTTDPRSRPRPSPGSARLGVVLPPEPRSRGPLDLVLVPNPCRARRRLHAPGLLPRRQPLFGVRRLPSGPLGNWRQLNPLVGGTKNLAFPNLPVQVLFDPGPDAGACPFESELPGHGLNQLT